MGWLCLKEFQTNLVLQETAKKNNAEPDNATKKNNDGGDVKTKAKPKKGGAAKKVSFNFVTRIGLFPLDYQLLS